MSGWARTGRAHGAAVGGVLTGTLCTGVFELARMTGACAELLELVALPFLKAPVTNRETTAVAHTSKGITVWHTPKGITVRFVGGLFKTAKP